MEYSGAAPDEIDLSAQLPIENAIRVRRIDGVTSAISKVKKVPVSMDGDRWFDVNYYWQVNKRLNRLSTLPQEAENWARLALGGVKKDALRLFGGCR
ncbi:hypothetical protein O9929_24605 [Vibrio lentus]|nr:hypothetical protein [Vibrio lentus]